MIGRRLILIELNEINFDVVKRYLEEDPAALPALRQLLERTAIRTSSESRYELLEPWIQWPSVHTGSAFDCHQVFRLGDITASDMPQFFEQLESRGYSVGAISAMNAANRLKSPAYFIPDPWTATPTDGSWWSRRLTSAISQAVNDNAESRIHPVNLLWLALGLARFARAKNFFAFLRLAFTSRVAAWRKSLFLDLFLHDLHLSLFNARKPNFSVLFLNGGAHIQHHYFLNARPLKDAGFFANPQWYVRKDVDPVAEMLAVYDRIVGDYLRLPGVDLIVATGLSQKPYDRVKYYYRPRSHADFLTQLGVRFQQVFPRMTRDFLVEFTDEAAALDGERILRSVTVEKQLLFADIDNRGASLFVTLTYPEEITEKTEFEINGRKRPLSPHVTFVAIKNGMHQGVGFAYFTGGVAPLAPQDGAHVSSLHETVMRYFSGNHTAL